MAEVQRKRVSEGAVMGEFRVGDLVQTAPGVFFDITPGVVVSVHRDTPYPVAVKFGDGVQANFKANELTEEDAGMGEFEIGDRVTVNFEGTVVSSIGEGEIMVRILKNGKTRWYPVSVITKVVEVPTDIGSVVKSGTRRLLTRYADASNEYPWISEVGDEYSDADIKELLDKGGEIVR